MSGLRRCRTLPVQRDPGRRPLISGLPEIRSLSAQVGYSRPAMARPRGEHLRGDGRRSWCDGRDAATIYFDLHQRTLRYELYFLPDPPARHEELYRFMLLRNHTTYGAHFSIGPDGDCYLVGRVLLEHLDVAELDRIIGVLYELVERWFQVAVGIAFRRR